MSATSLSANLGRPNKGLHVAVYGQSSLCRPILFHSDTAHSQTDGQSLDRSRFQDKDRFSRITKGNLSGLPEKRQKELKFRSILSSKSAKLVTLAG